MFQLLDAVETYRSNAHGERAVQCVTLIGKKLDGTIVIRTIEGIKHEVFVAVSDRYQQEQADALVLRLNRTLANGYVGQCQRTGCGCGRGRGAGEEYAVNTHACSEWRATDERAVVEATLERRNALVGAEMQERPFVRFVLTRSYYANNRLLTLLEDNIDSSDIAPHYRGVYELNNKCVDSYLNLIGCGGFDWFNEEDGSPVPPEQWPPETTRCPLRVLIFDIETPSLKKEVPQPGGDVPIATIAFQTRWDMKMYFLATRGEETIEVADTTGSTMFLYEDERSMLVAFHRMFMEHDPDFVVGYHSNAFDMPFVALRMKQMGLPQWNQWSRLRDEPLRFLNTVTRSQQKGAQEQTLVYCPGRCFLDVLQVAKNDQSLNKCRNKKLDSLSKWLGFPGKTGMKVEELHPSFHGSKEARGRMREYNEEDVIQTGNILDKLVMVDRLVANCRVFRILPRHDLERGVSYKVARLLLSLNYGRYLRRNMRWGATTGAVTIHEDLSYGYDDEVNALADKDLEDIGLIEETDEDDGEDDDEDDKAKKPPPVDEEGTKALPLVLSQHWLEMALRKTGFKGGLVLKATPQNIRQWLGVLDFASLYPSVIERHNICPSTWVRCREEADEAGLVEGVDYDKAPNGAFFLTRETKVGIIPRLCRFLVDKRNATKALIKRCTDPTLLMSLNAIEGAFKVAANSVYGQLGMSTSHIGLVCAGDAVTAYGRRYLRRVVRTLARSEFTKTNALRVVYGDTDSCFFAYDAPDVDAARRVFMEAEYLVNVKAGFLQAPMKVARDSLSQQAVMATKKRYVLATIPIEPGEPKRVKVKSKGMQFVKGDSVPYAQVTGKKLMEGIMEEGWSDDEIVSYVKAQITKLLLGEVSREQFIMSMKLSKPLAEYSTAGHPPPHVAAALLLQDAGKEVRSGECIEYYMCGTAHQTKKMSSKAVPVALADDYDLDWEVYLGRFVEPFRQILTIVVGEEKTKTLLDGAYYPTVKPFVKTRLTEMLGMGKRKVTVTRKTEDVKRLKRSQHTLDKFFTK
jgi:DNA polymerase elongation subunit (family B)